MNGLIVDNFAGGGGASVGIEQAMNRPIDIAINHDPEAIAMHMVNHPFTKHYTEDVWDIDPVEVCAGRPVDLAWFSPDCKHFSKAKGGKPKSKKIRGLAWVAVKWAKLVHPKVIILENVEEFKTWGPLDEDGHPVKELAGETFRRFVKTLERYEYAVEFRELTAADYGAPTTRRRFFMIARCDGNPICWPEREYAQRDRMEVICGLLKPYTPVSSVINYSIPCPSIFASKSEIKQKYGVTAVRPLADKTLNRIAKGINKFLVNDDDPFVMDGKAYALIQYHSETSKDEARGQTINDPIMTVDSSNRYGLVAYHIMQLNNHVVGSSMNEPINTICAGAGHLGEVRSFLIKYYGQGIGQRVTEPIQTITAKDRLGLVNVKGSKYTIADIGIRMLTPRELFDAQGFPHSYVIDHDVNGNRITKKSQVARCGNAVPPAFSRALVSANINAKNERIAS